MNQGKFAIAESSSTDPQYYAIVSIAQVCPEFNLSLYLKIQHLGGIQPPSRFFYDQFYEQMRCATFSIPLTLKPSSRARERL